MIAYMSGLLAFTAYTDRFILGYFAGAGAVGILLIARQLQQLPAMFNQMLIMVGAPMFAAAHGRNSAAERQHIYTLMTDWVVRASLPLMVFLLIFDVPMLRLFGDDFASGGATALLILIAAQIINLASGPIGNLIMMSGLEKSGLRIDAVLTVFGTALQILLIPFFGLIGAAVASAVTLVFSNACLLIVARRHLGIHWWDRRLLCWFFPSISMSIVGIAIRESGISMGPVSLIATLLAMYMVFFGVNFLQGLHKDDKDLLRHLRLQVLRWKYA